MKVVLDTNVLVSGVFWKGPPAKILDAWAEQKFRLVVSPVILDEYQAILRQLEQKYSAVTASQAILRAIGIYADVVQSIELPEPVCTDPDDDKFLAAALSGNAGFIVTGDAALLKTDGYKALRVLKPAAFLRLV